MIECNFEEKLRKLCEEYDTEYGDYPESEYQGRALYEFYLEKHPSNNAD